MLCENELPAFGNLVTFFHVNIKTTINRFRVLSARKFDCVRVYRKIDSVSSLADDSDLIRHPDDPDKFLHRSILSKERFRRWNRLGHSRTNGDGLIKFIVNAHRARSRNARTIPSGTRLIKIHLSLKSRPISGFCKRRKHATTTDFPLALLPDLTSVPFSLPVLLSRRGKRR